MERWTLYSSYGSLCRAFGGTVTDQTEIIRSFIGGIAYCFPAMASLFAYMFTAPYYMFAVLLMIVAVYTAVRYPYGYLPAIVIIAFSMGIYQTYFGVATSLFVLILLRDMEDRSFAQNVMEAFKYLFTLLGGMLLYFLCNRVCIKIFQITLVEYQGINNMANVTMRSLIGSVKRAYLGFFQPIFRICVVFLHIERFVSYICLFI